MNRSKIAQYIALGATVLSVTAFVLAFKSNSDFGKGFASILLIIGIFGSLVSYILGGGLGKALSISGKIAKWGWIVIPFPFDIVTGICTFIYAVMALLFLPIIPVRMAYKERHQ